MADLDAWLRAAVADGQPIMFKRLSANDTGATRSHQSGPYVPKRVAFAIVPALRDEPDNPRRSYDFELLSHDQRGEVSLIYYNRAKDECHLTGLGGRASALQDPENTSAILVLVFRRDEAAIEGWLATSIDEETVIESVVGTVDPGVVGYTGPSEGGELTVFGAIAHPAARATPEVPAKWLASFPSGAELTATACARYPLVRGDVDAAFMSRHSYEYELFQAVEVAHVLPKVHAGFTSLADFLGLAQTVLQRRKSRAGRSIELHLATIFGEQGVKFDAQPETEKGHRPDFVFPGITRYRSAQVGDARIAMLAAKSTLRDRWRQVLREADKVSPKHLFTLDEGLSESLFRDITREGIIIVAPSARLRLYPPAARPSVLTLRQFVSEMLRSQGL